jgi:tRNA-specific 2-thiouridylase
LELTKPEVREIAAQMELVTAERKTLKVCVLGKCVYQILQQKLEQKRCYNSD